MPEHPNVAIKLSGFGVFNPRMECRQHQSILSEVIAAFTPGRCMFATNYPLRDLQGLFVRSGTRTSRCLSEFSADEQESSCAGVTPHAAVSAEPLKRNFRQNYAYVRLLAGSVDFRLDLLRRRTTIRALGRARDRRVGAGQRHRYLLAQLLAQVSEQLGKAVRASTTSAARAASSAGATRPKAAPDGYTLTMLDTGVRDNRRRGRSRCRTIRRATSRRSRKRCAPRTCWRRDPVAARQHA